MIDLIFKCVVRQICDCPQRVMSKKRWHHDKFARIAKAVIYLPIPSGAGVLIHLKGLFGT